MNRPYPDSNSLDELDSAIDNSVARDALDDAMHGGGKIKALRPIPRDQNLAHTMALIRSSKSERSISMGDAVDLPRSLSRRRLAPMEPQGSMRMIRPLEEEPCSMIDPPSDKEKTYLPLPETLGRMTNQSSRSKSADPQRSKMLLQMAVEPLSQQNVSKEKPSNRSKADRYVKTFYKNEEF